MPTCSDDGRDVHGDESDERSEATAVNQATINTYAAAPTPGVDTTGAAKRGNIPWIVLAVVWMLIVCTFSMPDRADGATVLDIISMMKLGSRAFSIVALAALFLWQWQPTRGRLVVQCLLPLGCFAAFGVLSAFWSPLRGVSLGQIGSFGVLLLLAANVALAWRSNASTSTLFLHVSLVLLAFNALLLLGSVLGGAGAAVRSDQAFVHATMAGANASTGLLVLLGARIVWGWRWSRLLLIPGCLVHGGLLYTAHSRTAVAATLIACALLYVVFVNRQLIWATMLVACVGVGLYVAMDPGLDLANTVVGSGTQYAERDQQSSIGSFSGREEMWEVVWDSYLDSPWIGHGYFVSSATGELFVWHEYGNWTAHNMVLQALVTTGIIGALLLFWGIARPVNAMLATAFMDHQHRLLVLFLFVLGSWYFVWGLMNESIMGPLQPESVVFFAMLGLGVGSTLSVVAKTQHQDSLAGRENRPVGAAIVGRCLDHA